MNFSSPNIIKLRSGTKIINKVNSNKNLSNEFSKSSLAIANDPDEYEFDPISSESTNESASDSEKETADVNDCLDAFNQICLDDSVETDVKYFNFFYLYYFKSFIFF